MTQSYRNARQGFLTDMLVDTTPIGSIIPNLKTTANSFDHNFVKAGGSYPALNETSGNAYLTGDNPAYTHEGYLYCDGSEYNISDYPALYSIIGNDYGGRSSSGIDVTNGGSGYTSNPTVTVDPPPVSGIEIQATASAVIDIQSGEVVSVNIIQSGSGYDWQNPPSVTFSGGGGSGAQAVVRIDPDTGGVRGINKANVFEWWGDPYLGT